VTHFNDLRTDIVLLYELKLAAANCEYELQTLRHRFETLAPGKVSEGHAQNVWGESQG
jgi:DNA methyltransferase 1-associated protein 1